MIIKKSRMVVKLERLILISEYVIGDLLIVKLGKN